MQRRGHIIRGRAQRFPKAVDQQQMVGSGVGDGIGGAGIASARDQSRQRESDRLTPYASFVGLQVHDWFGGRGSWAGACAEEYTATSREISTAM